MDPVSDRGVQAHRPGQTHHRYETGTRHQIRIIKGCADHRRVMA